MVFYDDKKHPLASNVDNKTIEPQQTANMLPTSYEQHKPPLELQKQPLHGKAKIPELNILLEKLFLPGSFCLKCLNNGTV